MLLYYAVIVLLAAACIILVFFLCKDSDFALVQVWVIVFGVVISHLDVWKSCTGQGIHFVVVSAALMSIFGLSAVAELTICVIGFRGECFLLKYVC